MKPVYKKYFVTVGLMWTGCFVLFFVIYLFVLAPQQRSKRQFATQLAEKKRICDFALKAARKETKVRLNKQLELLRNRLNSFAVDFENAANLTFDISQIANEQNVTGFSIGSEENCKDVVPPNCRHIYENHIAVSFIGSFNQFAALLNALERHQPVIFIDKFAVTCSEKNASAHQVSMDLAVFVAKLRSG